MNLLRLTSVMVVSIIGATLASLFLRAVRDGTIPLFPRKPVRVYAAPFCATNPAALAGEWSGSLWRISLNVDGTAKAHLVQTCGNAPPIDYYGSWTVTKDRVQLWPTNTFGDISLLQTLQLSNRLFLLPMDPEYRRSYKEYGVGGFSCIERISRPPTQATR